MVVVYNQPPKVNSAFYTQAKWEMSSGQSAEMLCDWKVKASMVYSTCGLVLVTGVIIRKHLYNLQALFYLSCTSERTFFSAACSAGIFWTVKQV